MIDAYLHIEGIKGESADDRHKDWIEVSSVAWSVHQPRTTTESTAGDSPLAERTFPISLSESLPTCPRLPLSSIVRWERPSRRQWKKAHPAFATPANDAAEYVVVVVP